MTQCGERVPQVMCPTCPVRIEGDIQKTEGADPSRPRREATLPRRNASLTSRAVRASWNVCGKDVRTIDGVFERRPGTHVRVLANELVRNIYLFQCVAVGDGFILWVQDRKRENLPHARGCREKVFAWILATTFWTRHVYRPVNPESGTGQETTLKRPCGV